ncbi:hypothetical protein ACRRTK_023686 [Alexandromys fortis]
MQILRSAAQSQAGWNQECHPLVFPSSGSLPSGATLKSSALDCFCFPESHGSRLASHLPCSIE